MAESLLGQIRAAADTIEYLQGMGGSVPKRESYTPRELRAIAKMLNGIGER